MIQVLLAVALLGASVGLALHAATRISVTADEPKHIGTAVHALSSGRCCLGRDNGPSVAIHALPLVGTAEQSQGHLVPGRNPWETGTRFLLERPDFVATVLRSRLVSVLLLAGLGVMVFLWSQHLYGPAGGLISLALFAFSPLLLAHGSLVSTDLHAAFFGTLACYAWFRARAPGAGEPRRLLASVCLGLALAAKYTLLALLPAFFVLDLQSARRGGAKLHRALASAGVYLGASLFPALLVLWLLYGARIDPMPLNGGPSTVPFLADWFDGLRALLAQNEQGWPAYLLGEYRTGSWWYYFPVAFAVKTPLPALLAVFAALVVTPWLEKVDLHREAFVWLPALVLFGVAVASNLNLGIRHLLPIYPLAHIFAGRLARVRFRSSPVWRTALVLLGLWYVGGTVRQHPDHLSFFNEIVGGERGGWRVLADSNLDMGQGLRALGRQLEAQEIPAVRLAYLGPIPPEAYGIPQQPLPAPLEALEGEPYTDSFGRRELLAVSVNLLAGVVPQARDTYAWLRPREPVARLEGALFLFDITGDAEAKRALVEIYTAAGAARFAEVERARLRDEP